MSQFHLTIVGEKKTYLRNSLHSHEIPRIGENVNLTSLFERDLINPDLSPSAAFTIKVTDVSHPISSNGYIVLPSVICEYSDEIPAGLLISILNSPDWAITNN